MRAAGLAVASGAADLLVIRLDAAGQRGVDDGADIGLVDAHAERDRGDDHFELAGEEPRPARVGGARRRARRDRPRRGTRRRAVRPRLRPACGWACRRWPGGAPGRAAARGRGRGAATVPISTTSMAMLSRRKPWMKLARRFEPKLLEDVVLDDRRRRRGEGDDGRGAQRRAVAGRACDSRGGNRGPIARCSGLRRWR